MGYQALLSSPDEKLARIVSQIFAELDFTVEPAPEPFGAVKRLMARHYDAVVVDCDNEQNASLIFKSARNSSVNQGSLAIALVEGQAGVAKAYRIGANLVLTKPINLEQAKGTLRVARGLLRKNSDATGGSVPTGADRTMPASAAPVSAAGSSPSSSSSGSSLPWVRRGEAAIVPNRPDLPESEAAPPSMIPDPLPADLAGGSTSGTPARFPGMTASAKVEGRPALPVPTTQIRITMADEPHPPAPQIPSPAIIKNDVGKTQIVKNDTVKIASPSLPTQDASSTFASPGAGAAPAPAKKVTFPPERDTKKLEWAPADRSPDAASLLGLASATDTFIASSEEEDSGGSGGSRRILIAAVVIFAFAAFGYLGYEKLGNPNISIPAAQPASTPPDSGKQDATPPTSASAAMSSPQAAPLPSASNRASFATQTAAPKTAAATSPDIPPPGIGIRPEIRIALDPGLGTKKPGPTPLVVKSSAAGSNTQAQPQEAAPAPPSTLAVAPPVAMSNDSTLSGLMASGASSSPKPSLTTPRVSQGVSQGLLIKRVQPKYPSAALAVHAHGAVQIEATINREGNVTNLKVLSGEAVLARAALEAVRQWRYKPYYLDGEPVEIETQITVNFKAN